MGNLQMSCWRYKGSIYKVMTGLCGVCVLFMWSNIFWVLYLQSLREDSLLVVYLSFLNMLMGFVQSGKGSWPGVFYRTRILKVRLASQDLFLKSNCLIELFPVYKRVFQKSFTLVL